MVTREADATVLLSDEEAAPALAAKLESAGGEVACYPTLAELVQERPLSSVAVLVLHFRPSPKGALLASLGRLSHEYPGMQKMAVVDDSVPLPIAEYMTACGVDFMWANEMDESGDRLSAVVDGLHERTRWVVT